MGDAALRLAVIGAGPAGLALALQSAKAVPQAHIALYDARPLESPVGRDPRVLALSLGSVQLLERLRAFDAAAAQPILAVHVSEQPSPRALLLRASEAGVPMLGAVLTHGQLVAPLQAAWLDAVTRAPARLVTRFGEAVVGLHEAGDGSGSASSGVEVETATGREGYDVAVVAEGGVFAPRDAALAPSDRDQVRLATPGRGPRGAPLLRHDYAQTAWVGQVRMDGMPPGTAFERFTRRGPAALLPLATPAGEAQRAALVWCVARGDDPGVREASDEERLALLARVFHPDAGRLVEITPLKAFPLGLVAEAGLLGRARRTVRIGNAAQTLHPVAGQGLNLGLRDAFELVRALERAARGERTLDEALAHAARRRAPDRWSMIAATDFLARSFTWSLPGAGVARGLGLAALQAAGPLRGLLARQMMFGWR